MKTQDSTPITHALFGPTTEPPEQSAAVRPAPIAPTGPLPKRRRRLTDEERNIRDVQRKWAGTVSHLEDRMRLGRVPYRHLAAETVAADLDGDSPKLIFAELGDNGGRICVAIPSLVAVTPKQQWRVCLYEDAPYSVQSTVIPQLPAFVAETLEELRSMEDRLIDTLHAAHEAAKSMNWISERLHEQLADTQAGVQGLQDHGDDLKGLWK